MYGARKLEAWEGKGVGVLAECGECDWSRVYPKASVRRSASHARRHYLSSHLTGADSGGATVETGTGTGAAGADAGGVDGGDIPKQLFQVTWFRADRHTHYGTYETGPFVNYVQGTSAAQVRKLFLTRSDGLVSRVKSVRSTESEYNARIIRAEARRNR